MQRHRHRTLLQVIKTSLAGILALVICAMPSAAVAANAGINGQEQSAFEGAAKEFQVPEQVLMAVSYYQSRWEDHKGQMSVDGGYGPMNLRTTTPVQDGRGDPARPVAKDKVVAPKGDMTLDKAAALIGQSSDRLKTDMSQNIRGGAAVLAAEAKKLNGGTIPGDLNDWYAVAAKYIGDDNAQNTQLFIDQIRDLIQKGQSSTTTDGQQLTLKALPQAPKVDLNLLQPKLQSLGVNMGAQPSTNDGSECPKTDNCRFVPAGYAANSSDPADYGNYDHANRPKDMKVNYIVIHDTEGSYASAISHFQDTTSYVSAHYVIRSSDGAVTQMVPTSNVAWHAGDWYMNMHSIGIEHEGYAAQGASWYTEAMYQSSANLVRYLAKKYDIPLDRDHIIGHDNIPGLTDARIPKMHWDPGPYWDWDHYMKLVQGKNSDNQAQTDGYGWKNAVTIKPTMTKNMQTVNICTNPADATTCVSKNAPSNFVYLRTAPQSTAPLIGDGLMHPGGEPGTNRIEDWTAKATYGQQYGLAEKRGDWTAIWFKGQKAWFYNPDTQPSAKLIHAKTIKLKPGLASTHVYGGAYPEPSVYPADVPGPAQTQLSYTIAAGQTYVSDGVAPTDYFYDATVDYSKPHDHEIFKGNDRFIKIWYNQRIMFVRSSDVMVE